MDKLEQDMVDLLLALAMRRGEVGLTEAQALALAEAERWLADETDGLRPPDET